MKFTKCKFYDRMCSCTKYRLLEGKATQWFLIYFYMFLYTRCGPSRYQVFTFTHNTDT